MCVCVLCVHACVVAVLPYGVGVFCMWTRMFGLLGNTPHTILSVCVCDVCMGTLEHGELSAVESCNIHIENGIMYSYTAIHLHTRPLSLSLSLTHRPGSLRRAPSWRRNRRRHLRRIRRGQAWLHPTRCSALSPAPSSSRPEGCKPRPPSSERPHC